MSPKNTSEANSSYCSCSRGQLNNLKNFLELSYDELETLNREAKQRQVDKLSDEKLEKHYLDYLQKEKYLKAVTVCFCDLNGRLHMLDYDKKFLVSSHNSLTFDGSSIRGFSVVRESDLRLKIDWGSFRWLPADIVGPGKVIVFGLIQDKDGTPYVSDTRGMLKKLSEKLYLKDQTTANVSVEIEGFLFKGKNVEQSFSSRNGFEFVSTGGYFNSLPLDPLKIFIDTFAEAKRAIGFDNEKDHPEVAPSQFELNYSYADALLAADQVLIYKLLARQVADNLGMTASFLPKPVAGINGSGMHTNISISKKGENIFYDKSGEDNLSKQAWDFVDRLLHSANDLCLIMNSSVNSYRRLDPNFEAPNQIRSSAVDRTSMIRIPLANEKSSRIEIRTVAPDSNPYLLLYSLIRTGLEGPSPDSAEIEGRRTRTRTLPATIQDAIRYFKASNYLKELIGEENHAKFAEQKQIAADRCPRELGTMVKSEEVLFHHEVFNQLIWSRF